MRMREGDTEGGSVMRVREGDTMEGVRKRLGSAPKHKLWELHTYRSEIV